MIKLKLNTIYQDNTNTTKLKSNDKLISRKKKRHFDIQLLYIIELISRDEVGVRYCPIDEIIGDDISKTLVGAKFQKFRYLIMNLSNIHHHIGQ